MEEIKVENVLNVCNVKGEGLREALNKVYSHTSDILVFSVQWKDLDEYLESVKGQVKERFRELDSKEVVLKGKSFALEERAKVVEAAEARFVDLEMEVEEKKKDLNFLKDQAEEVRLSQLRTVVEECAAEKMLKESEEIAKMETDLERLRGEVNAEMDSLRKLDGEVEMKRKDLTFVETKLAECERLLEIRSSELFKTQDEFECKQEGLGKTKADLVTHRVQVCLEMQRLRLTQTRMRQLDEDVEMKTKDLTLVQDKLAECEKLLETRSSELVKIHGELESKQEQLGKMEAELEKHRIEVSAEKEPWERTQTQSRDMEEETERKKKDLAVALDKIAECRTQLKRVEEQLDSQQNLLETLSSELVYKEKELKVLSLDIDLREETIISLNNDMKETCQQMKSKAKELENVERLIEERSAHCESLKLLIVEHSEELVSKEKRHEEITDAIRKLSLDIVFQEKTRERAQVFIKKLSERQGSAEKELDLTRRHLERCINKHESKKKLLRIVKDRYRECLQDLDIKEKELKSVQSILTERNKQVEEGEKKLQHVNSSNEELDRQLKLKQKEVCSINKTIRACSCELEAKRKHCEEVQISITNLIAEINSKESQLSSVEKKIQDSSRDEEEQVRLIASLMEREEGIKLKEKELGAREEMINNKAHKLKSTEHKLAKSSKKTELKAKKQGKTVQQVDLVRDVNVREEKTLQMLLLGHLKKRDQLHLDVLSSVKGSSDPAKLVLETLNGLYSAHQRTAVKNLDPKSVQRSSIFLLECLMDMSPSPTTEEVQGEAIKFATEWKNTTLVKKDNPVEVLGFLHFLAAFSLAYTSEIDEIQTLFDVALLRKYAPSLCKALGVSALAPVNNVLLLEDNPQQQPPKALISNTIDSRSSDVQQNIASSHLPNEDALMDFEDSTSFSPNEVSTKLPMFKNPGRYVLTSLDDALFGARQRGELSLAEPIVKTLIPFLEELAQGVVSTDPGLRFDAVKVAHEWIWMMRASVEKSQLEAWAFLQFIVAYGLVKLTNQDQTLQFGSHVSHFRHAPKLFQSLGLTHAIPNFVKQLLNKAMYIPAIRFMFYFNVKNNFSPLEFLKEVIINLRRSAKECESQAEASRDAAIMRDIMELIDDFKLEIDIPVDLILKFMVPRKIQIQNSSHVPVQSTHMRASHTLIQSSCVATHGSNPILPTSFGTEPNQPVIDVETYQAGGSTAFEGQSSHLAGFKRPRVDHGPVIRP